MNSQIKIIHNGNIRSCGKGQYRTGGYFTVVIQSSHMEYSVGLPCSRSVVYFGHKPVH